MTPAPDLFRLLKEYEHSKNFLNQPEEREARRLLIGLFPPSTEPFFRYCPHIPTVKQLEFINLGDREAFYGGAAGGGKSDALLMGALLYVDVPGYNALILRRTYADLSKPEALIDRAHEWLDGTDAHWNEMVKKWVFPGGASVSFGHLDHEGAKYQFQSAAYQYIAFDEVTQFTQSQYLYLFSRLRRLRGRSVPLRMRCAANPDGIGFEWVKRRFVNPGSRERPFVPARLQDNPHLDQEEYARSLAELDPITRARLLNGDWTVRPEGKVFRRHWFEIVEDWPREAKQVRYWDLAATRPRPGQEDPDFTAGVKACISRDKIVYLVDVRRMRDTPGAVEQLVKQTAIVDGKNCQVVMEEEPGSSGKTATEHYRKHVLLGYSFKADKVTGRKEHRAAPLASYAEAGNVKLVAGPWNEAFLDEVETFPDGEHDDQVDAAAGAFAYLTEKGESIAELLYRKGVR